MTRKSTTTVDIVINDCGYGFSAYAVLADGTRACHTKELKATAEAARNDVVRSINTSIPDYGYYTAPLTFDLTSEF